jgi:putative phage-type endonuclease
MPLTAEQKANRAGGIGGSDAGVIAGVSPRKTIVQLWQEKTGRVPEEDLSDNELIEWGHELEGIIGKVWAKRTGQKIRRVNRTLYDREFPWMLGHIDFDVVGKSEGLECKNGAFWMRDLWGDEDSDDVPLYYLIQGVHYMRVYDCNAWNFAVLIGGNELKKFRVTRDPEAEKQLIDLERLFWNCVLQDVPPPPMKVEDLVRCWPKTAGVVVATEELALAVGDYKALRAERKKLDTRMDELKLAIGRFMEQRSELVDPHDSSQVIATYRAHDERRIDADKLRREYPEIAEACTKIGTVRKFLPK